MASYYPPEVPASMMEDAEHARLQRIIDERADLWINQTSAEPEAVALARAMKVTKAITYTVYLGDGQRLGLCETEARGLLAALTEALGATEPRRLSGMDVAHATRRSDLPDYDPAESIARESARRRDGMIGSGADVVVLKPGEPPQEPDELEQARRAFGVGRKIHTTSQALLDELRDGGGDAENLAARLDWPEWKVSQTAASLVKRGLVEASKLGKRTQYALPLGTQS